MVPGETSSGSLIAFSELFVVISILHFQSLSLKDEQLAQMEAQCSQLSRELSHVRSHLEQGHYRIEHLDTMRQYEVCVCVCVCVVCVCAHCGEGDP